MKKFAIIGLSSFGINLALTLAKHSDVEVIAIDEDERKVNQIKDLVTRPITMDGTNRENLESIGIKEMDCVVVSMGPSLEPSIIAVHLLKELGARKIIAKALSEDHEKILTLVGATEVSYPERDVARKIGSRLRFDNLLDYLPIESGFMIQEIAPPDSFVGKTLAEIHLRKKYNVTVIAIKSLIPEETHINPGADFVVKESDILLVFGTEGDISKLHKRLNNSR
ncbi:MAG TPA: TrkA family potassium uptake protein [Candidatus Aminicenantes bacterium]|nr:TrkA family potassium uptake protein [Candidatus Aminicenantes bacterium]